MEKIDLRKLSETERQKVRDSVKRVIQRTNNIAKTARILGIPRQTVYNWLRPTWQGEELVIKKRGRKSELTETQINKLKVLISNDTPESVGLSFLLWSPKAVRTLIKREYDKSFSYETTARFLREWGFIPAGSASIYWSDEALYNEYFNPEIIKLDEYIEKNNAQSYYIGVCKRDSVPGSFGTHTIFAFTKNGHVKFMNVKWDRYASRFHPRQVNSYKNEDFTLFLTHLKKQSHRNLVVMYVNNKIRKHAGGIRFGSYAPKGVRVILVSVRKRMPL